MSNHSCCNQQKVKRGLWSPDEDERLITYLTKHSYRCWSEVPEKAGLQRCGKSCRLRWINYLRPGIRRGRFTPEEEELIISLHSVVGNRWAHIAKQLPGRTDNEIKNYCKSWIKKKRMSSIASLPAPSTSDLLLQPGYGLNQELIFSSSSSFYSPRFMFHTGSLHGLFNDGNSRNELSNEAVAHLNTDSSHVNRRQYKFQAEVPPPTFTSTTCMESNYLPPFLNMENILPVDGAETIINEKIHGLFSGGYSRDELLNEAVGHLSTDSRHVNHQHNQFQAAVPPPTFSSTSCMDSNNLAPFSNMENILPMDGEETMTMECLQRQELSEWVDFQQCQGLFLRDQVEDQLSGEL